MSHYEINVSEKQDDPFRKEGFTYIHLFATHERSLQSQPAMLKVYAKLKTAFPEPEYNVSVTYQTCGGEQVSTEALDKQARAQGWIK